MATYQSYLSSYNRDFNRFTNQFKNPYEYSLGSPSSDVVSTMTENMMYRPPLEIDENRSFLDRTLDTLMLPTYAGAGFVDGLVDGSGEGTRTPWQGMIQGIQAGNPFGKGYIKGETTYSDVLHSAGWQPEGTLGKIGKGVIGFGLDVVLDPTTYLTGGISAGIKGTGRVGKSAEALAKLGDDIPYMQFDNTVRELTEKGINPQLAERFAQKKLDDALKNPTQITEMTEELATDIIKYQTAERGVVKSAEEIKNSAQTLASEYNRILGLRQNGEVTFGIGNMPFAPKSWRDKTIRLGGDASIRQLSDKLGISSAYAGVRNFIYGSQIGKMFSTTSPMWKLAQKDPSRLWEVLEYVEHTRGIKMDKLQSEKEIRDRFKSLGLTEAENKEVLSLLQDKRVWNKIAEKVQFKDLDQVKEIRKVMEERIKKDQNELNTLLEKKEVAETWRKALNDNIIPDEKQFLNTMKDEFQKDLATLDTRNLTKISDMNKLIENMSKEITDIEARIARSTNPASDAEALETLYKSYKDEADKSKFYMENAQSNKFSHKAEDAPTRVELQKMEKALSNYIFGESGHLKGLRDSNVEDLMKRVREGENPDVLAEYIINSPELFGSHMKDVYMHIAEELGYRYWHGDGFKNPLARLIGISDEKAKEMNTSEIVKLVSEAHANGKLNTQQTLRFAELLQREMQRKIMIREYSRMSPEEFKVFRTEQANQRLMDDFAENELGELELKRNQWVDDISASEGRRNTPPRDVANTQIANFTSRDRTDVVRDMMDMGLFKREILNISDNKGLNQYINAIVDEVDHYVTKQYQMNYSDLSQGQKRIVFELATQSVAKGKRGIDGTVTKRAHQEALLRAQEDKIKSITNEVTKGHDLIFKEGNDTYRGLVHQVIRDSDDNVRYEVVIPTTGEIKTIKPLDITRIRKNNERITPSELVMRSDVAQNDIARKEVLTKELRKVQDELQTFTGEANKTRNESIKFYEARIKEQQSYVEQLEARHKEFGQWLHETNPDKLEAMNLRIKHLENTLANDDALETWMRTHSELDVELMKDPMRHLRNVIMRDDLPDNWFASVGKDGVINVSDKPIDKKAFFQALKFWENEFKKRGTSWEDIKGIINNPKKMEQFIMEHELSHVRNQDFRTRPHRGGNDDPATREVEMRANMDALNMLRNMDVDKMLREAQPADAGKVMLSNVASSKKVEEVVRTLRAEFDKMGLEEIGIGKLTEEQFKGMLNQYVPHILTLDGQEHFAKLRELTEHGSKVTHDMGYGVVYNPHAKSRSIEGKTIEEINAHFRDKLQGKNLFSENVADLYLERAMKHNELMYDDKYMRTMMNVFGKEIPENGVIEDGYKAVMNYGMMRETVSDIASMQLSMRISDDVREFITNNVQSIQEMARRSNLDPQKLIQQNIDEFLKKEYPDEKMGEIFKGLQEDAIKGTKLPKDIMGREGVPMVEMQSEQINAMRGTWNNVYEAYSMSLQRSLNNAMQRGDMVRVAEVQKRIDGLSKRTPPQIKQVNDTIVMKANQARKLQQAKDQSRFLQLYDKFLHFMKLNQTVVVPSFHMRNKMSNAFQNWLGSGRDAVDKDLQIATTVLARNKGDVDALKMTIDAKKFGHKQLSKPINIDNPHPSLVEAVGLNNGQLHWNDVYELALRYDVIDSGQFAADIGAGASTKGMFPKLRQTRPDGSVRNLDPTDTENFILYKKGTEVGTVVENGDRILHFISQLKQGKSIQEAQRSSKEFLFDYSDLTAFEQYAMKRVFPYYTWLRKNARLQVSQLIEQPGKYRDVAKVMTGVEHMTPQEERMNPAFISDWGQDWIQTPFSMTNEEGNTEPLLLNPAMPFMDLNRIPNPMQPIQSARELFTQSSPQLKVPTELAMNRNVFLDSPITREGSNPAVDVMKYLGSQFGLVNAVNGVAGRDNGTDAMLGALNATTGVKMNSYDYERAKQMKIAEILGNAEDTPQPPRGAESLSDKEVAQLYERATGRKWSGASVSDKEGMVSWLFETGKITEEEMRELMR